jgi:hypothetical protein
MRISLVLSNEPEASHCKMMIERIGDPDPYPFHDGKARGIDCRKLMKIGTPEVLPRLFQIA